MICYGAVKIKHANTRQATGSRPNKHILESKRNYRKWVINRCIIRCTTYHYKLTVNIQQRPRGNRREWQDHFLDEGCKHLQLFPVVLLASTWNRDTPFGLLHVYHVVYRTIQWGQTSIVCNITDDECFTVLNLDFLEN